MNREKPYGTKASPDSIFFRRKISAATAILAAVILLSGCRKDEIEPAPAAALSSVSLQVCYSVSDIKMQETKSLSASNENAISQVYILAFKDVGNGTSTNNNFLYSRVARINPDGKSLNVQLLSINGIRQKLYFIANAGSAVETALRSISTTTNEQAAIALLSYSLSSATPGINSTGIPMWAKSSSTNISSSTTSNEIYLSGTGSISFLRTLARINVTNDSPDFNLSSVTLCNAPDKAALVPALNALAANGWSGVAAPTVLRGTGAIPPQTFMVPDGHNLLNTIYLAESDNISVQNRVAATCIIIGGSIRNSPVTYYRIDIANSQGYRMNILRNHSYNISIHSIAGNGYPTVQDALNSEPINRASSSSAISISDNFTELVTDGSSYLALGSITESDEAGLHVIVIPVLTNAAEGWTATATGQSWIIEKTYSQLRIKCPMYGRSGTIQIRAGRLTINKNFNTQS